MATLLLIDPSELHRAQLRAAVEPAGLFDEILEAADGIAGTRVFLDKRVDVVVCRGELGGVDAAGLLPAFLDAPGRAAAPIVFLSAKDDPESRARLLDAGATDVLTMPVHFAELVARLRIHLRRKRMQDDLRVKDETLARLSTVDPLTGLRTRRYADDVLATEFLRARRHDNPLAILLGDLDHLVRVNDEVGHLAGDAALRGVASVLLHDLRCTDVAARYGGGEILVVLAQNDLSGARILAERWRESVEESRFADPAGQVVGVTLSIGIAALDGETVSPEALVGAADAALHRAKAQGRNRVELAGPA
ncbi:MAG: diguanylate cyclase [bacterium]|nr:diguanylate cyclase [bacterium]